MKLLQSLAIAMLLVGCTSACPSQKQETQPEAKNKEVSFELFPSCLKGKNLQDAANRCTHDNFDWTVTKIKGTYEGLVSDVQGRTEGTVYLEVNDGVVTRAQARFKKLENAHFDEDK